MTQASPGIIPHADVLGILGSPRRHGNSETLLDRALEGAKEAGRTVSKIVLNDLNIRPCQNCGYCERTGECHVPDEMTLVRQALDAARVVIIASPIYFASVSAQTKIMIDRCQVYWSRKYVLKRAADPRERQGYFISVGGFAKGHRFFTCGERVISTWYLVQDIAYVKGLFYPGVDKKGDAQGHESAMKECHELGRSM
jgi:multimeric flavodoxin WrbA